MTKKSLLTWLLFNSIFLLSVADNTDFDKAEFQRALDLINKADEKPLLKKWYAKNLENRFKAWFAFNLLSFTCGESNHKIAKAASTEGHEQIRKDCNENLEFFNDLFIKSLKALNTVEGNELAEIFERKAQHRRRVLDIPKVIPVLNPEDVVTEDDLQVKGLITANPSFDAKSYIDAINTCQLCVGTGKTVYPEWCNTQRKAYEVQSFLWDDGQDEAQIMKMERVARNIKSEFEKAGEPLEPSDIDQNGIIQSHAELEMIMRWEDALPQNSKEQAKILKLINVCQTNDIAHHSDTFADKCQGLKEAFQSLSELFKEEGSYKKQIKCDSIVKNIEKRQSEA